MVVAFLMYSPWYKKGRNEGENGNYNGYVAFKEELPLSLQSSGGDFNTDEELLDSLAGVHSIWDFDIYEKLLDSLVSVHGGITLDIKSLWEDVAIIPLTAVPEDIHEYRVIGFDTGHVDDTAEYWTFERTKEETLNLKEQIERLIESRK